MNERLFTFGCSFTQYRWPTWADILSQEYSYFQNWGKVGGGNHYIFYSLIECITRNNISVDDTIAIMWTSIGREDKYLNGKWFTPGSIYNSEYPTEYVKKFTDPDGFLITNIAIIEATKRILDDIGCEYYMFQTVPLSVVDDSYKHKIFNLSKEYKIVSLYKKTLDVIYDNIYHVIYNNDWNSRDDVIIPSAIESSKEDLKTSYDNCSGEDWPPFDDFISNNYSVSRDIENEIDNQWQFNVWRDNIYSKRQDDHLIPLEHYEYLQKVGVELSKKQLEYARYWNNIVLTQSKFNFNTNMPKNRF